jgi:hypothetical protein
MYTGFQHLHSAFAYVVLALIVIVILIALIGKLGGKPFSSSLKRLALWSMLALHLQFVVGIALYFLSPLGFSAMSGEAMSDSMLRLYVVEHPITMLLGIIVITIGHGRMKRTVNDDKKYMQLILFYTIGLALVLSRIPWTAWLG